jgi:hypothetical protein
MYTQKEDKIVNTIDISELFIQQMTALFQSYSLMTLVLFSIVGVKANTTHEWTLKELHLLGWALALIVYYSYVGATTFWF